MILAKLFIWRKSVKHCVFLSADTKFSFEKSQNTCCRIGIPWSRYHHTMTVIRAGGSPLMRLQQLRSVWCVAVRELYRRKTQWRGIRRMFTNWAPTTRRYRHRSDVSPPFHCPSAHIYIYICHHLLLLLLHLVHCSFSQMSAFHP